VPVPPTFDARLVHARALSPSVRGLHLERSDGAPFVFEAGQWVSLALPVPGGVLRRAYSIASPPDNTSGFDLAVTRVLTGPGSTYLHGIEPGVVLSATGPQGFFTRSLEVAPPALFVGTGTGVAPLVSMMKHAVAEAHPAPMILLFGARNEGEILYWDELRAIAAQNPHVSVEVTLSQPAPGWEGRRGYVQLHLRELYDRLARVSPPASPPHAFVCGLERMVGSVREILRKELGLPRTSVHSERYD
jgi:CDP-4-dehydro-6-deoxyglucose reductase, E3